MTKCDKCGEWWTAQCPVCFSRERASGSLQPDCCAALVEKIKAARDMSAQCWEAGFDNKNVSQRKFSAGQLDAFDAVLMWIHEAQHNEKADR